MFIFAIQYQIVVKRFFVKISYIGSQYHGWQMQPNANSIQAELEKAFSLLMKQNIKLIGAGRTDTGVHAEVFYAHFDYTENNENIDLQLLIYKTNALLPADISIFDIFEVQRDASARFDAISRTYEYRICQYKNPFLNGFAWFMFSPLDIDIMNKGCEILMKNKDFTSFSKLHSQTKTNLCNIYKAEWKCNENNVLIFEITANRFLRNMVRSIVGTLVELGQHKILLDDLQDIIDNKNRSLAGFSVPAQGLFLTKIIYNENIYLK